MPADCFVLALKSEHPTRSDANLNGESDPITLATTIDKSAETESQFPCNALPAGSIILTGTVLAMVVQTVTLLTRIIRITLITLTTRTTLITLTTLIPLIIQTTLTTQ